MDFLTDGLIFCARWLTDSPTLQLLIVDSPTHIICSVSGHWSRDRIHNMYENERVMSNHRVIEDIWLFHCLKSPTHQLSNSPTLKLYDCLTDGLFDYFPWLVRLSNYLTVWLMEWWIIFDSPTLQLVDSWTDLTDGLSHYFTVLLMNRLTFGLLDWPLSEPLSNVPHIWLFDKLFHCLFDWSAFLILWIADYPTLKLSNSPTVYGL